MNRSGQEVKGIGWADVSVNRKGREGRVGSYKVKKMIVKHENEFRKRKRAAKL